MFTLIQIKVLLEENDIDSTISAATEYINENPGESMAYFLRGKAFWRKGDKRQAMTDYATAAQLDPNSPAVHALSHSREIMDFYNPDLLNP